MSKRDWDLSKTADQPIDFFKAGFLMDTAQAYDKMQEANRIVEDFPVGRYALFTILFLVEIAICFAIIYAL